MVESELVIQKVCTKVCWVLFVKRTKWVFEITNLGDSRANSNGCIVGRTKLFSFESDTAGVFFTIVIIIVVIVKDNDDLLFRNILRGRRGLRVLYFHCIKYHVT